jgi:hypothetical protein
MSVEGLVERIGEAADRRRFLRKVGVASLGALGFSVFAESAQAYDFACCHLCNAPSGSCQGSVACSWCWNCCSGPRALFRCCEGYAAGAGCSGSCPATCSYYINLGCCVC